MKCGGWLWYARLPRGFESIRLTGPMVGEHDVEAAAACQRVTKLDRRPVVRCSGMEWYGVWRVAVMCGVVWCGVVWCGVVVPSWRDDLLCLI